MLPANWLTRDSVRTLSDRQKLVLIAARARTSACGVADVGLEEMAWIVGNGCTSDDVREAFQVSQRLGLIERDEETNEVFFIDFFKFEKFYGKGWSMLDKSVQKIESKKIKKSVEQHRPHPQPKPADDLYRMSKMDRIVAGHTRIGVGSAADL